MNLECVAKQGIPFCFSINQTTMTINPHEFFYIKIRFKPEIMTIYEGVFNAKVIHPDAKESSNLKFNLKGEGILPTVKLNGPNFTDQSLNFGKLKLMEN